MKGGALCPSNQSEESSPPRLQNNAAPNQFGAALNFSNLKIQQQKLAKCVGKSVQRIM